MKSQVKLFEIHCFPMFIPALYVVFPMKIQWLKNMGLYNKRSKVKFLSPVDRKDLKD